MRIMRGDQCVLIGVGCLLALTYAVSVGAQSAPAAGGEAPGAAAANGNAAAGSGSAAQQTDEQQEQATLDAMFGRDAEGDYVAKNFSLIFGMVVLDPFKFSTPAPAPTATPGMAQGADDGDDDDMPSEPVFTLDTGGDVDVRAFFEAGVRYRWAWRDRIGVGAVPPGRETSAACSKTKADLLEAQAARAEAEDTLNIVKAREEKKVKSVDQMKIEYAERDMAGANETEKRARKKEIDRAEAPRTPVVPPEVPTSSDIARLAARMRTNTASLSLEDAQREFDLWRRIEAQVKEKAIAETKAYYYREWTLAQDGLPVDIACWRWTRRRQPPTHCGDEVRDGTKTSCLGDEDWVLNFAISRCFLPADFQARVGYVFNGGSPAGLASVASSSNVYGDLIGGLNLIRATLPTNSPEETPMRASINLEGLVSLTTDTDSVDVHGRYLVGPALAVGVPLMWIRPNQDRDDDDQEDAKPNPEATATTSKAPTPVPTPELAGIVEVVARIGAVNVDVPSFKSTTGRQVELTNDQPDFSGEWGLGLDLELNIPIAERWGYITARATINEFITPSPWGLQFGYTIPLSTVTGFVTGFEAD